eukprot:1648770-Rhodomonas_salina.1
MVKGSWLRVQGSGFMDTVEGFRVQGLGISGLTVQGSRFTVHGHSSGLTVHGSRLTVHGSELTLHASRFTLPRTAAQQWE